MSTRTSAALNAGSSVGYRRNMRRCFASLAAVIAISCATVGGAEPPRCADERGRFLRLKANEVPPPASYEWDRKPKQTSIPTRALAAVPPMSDFVATAQCPAALSFARFERGRYFYRWHDFEKAIEAFREVLEQHPGGEHAQYALGLLLDSLNTLERYDETRSVVDHACAETSELRKQNAEIAKICSHRRDYRYLLH